MGTRQKYPFSLPLFNIVLEVLASIGQEKKRKCVQNRMEEIKTVSNYRWHKRICRKFKESTKKFPELISEFNKVAGYKINIQNSVVFLYISIKEVKTNLK